jgi:hypothetical protein
MLLQCYNALTLLCFGNVQVDLGKVPHKAVTCHVTEYLLLLSLLLVRNGCIRGIVRGAKKIFNAATGVPFSRKASIIYYFSERSKVIVGIILKHEFAR